MKDINDEKNISLLSKIDYNPHINIKHKFNYFITTVYNSLIIFFDLLIPIILAIISLILFK
jgi:hypothetical protein